MANVAQDKSNGYEQVAHHFMAARNVRIGPATVKKWSKTLIPKCAVLDLACGYGEPISNGAH